jgi:glyoxylase-like metal-dependent hydrolase (beta-lactamase superfamily II)
MILKSLDVGPLAVNCYVIGDEITKKAMIVDPGDEPDRIMDMIYINGLKAEYIVLTHAHFDHVGAVPDIKEATGALIALHEDEMELYEGASEQAAFWGYGLPPLPKPDMLLKEGDNINIGYLNFTVLHTPGHSPGCICLYGEGMVITGDTLFQGSVGRTDFYGGNMKRLRDSFKRLMSLPDSTAVLPGHGPSTFIKREREENFFSEEAI